MLITYQLFTVNVLIICTPNSEKWHYANSADPDQTAPSDQGQHCLPFHYVFQETTVYKKKQNLGKRME